MSGEGRVREDKEQLDGGAYIGNQPGLASIPGGVSDDDERVAGYDSRSSGSGRQDERVQGRGDERLSGHRDATIGMGD